MEADREGSVRLDDGRTLAYRASGNPSGPAVLFFHGWPGSRLDFLPNEATATDAGLRVIAIDRPGIGRSDHQPGRALADWPADVAALADSLGISDFSVMGFSFGAPYARICAHRLGDRVRRIDLVSALGPMGAAETLKRLPGATRYGLGAARISPSLAIPMAAMTARAARRGDLVRRLAASMPPPDAAVLERGDVGAGLGASLAECFRQGVRPAAWDGVAVARGKEPPPAELGRPTILWHGALDRNDPVEMARDQERALPRGRGVYFEREGHLVFFSRIAEILDEIARDVGSG
jgi:pimeloyl-ACP methyl ester carboxylesterase